MWVGLLVEGMMGNWQGSKQNSVLQGGIVGAERGDSSGFTYFKTTWWRETDWRGYMTAWRFDQCASARSLPLSRRLWRAVVVTHPEVQTHLKTPSLTRSVIHFLFMHPPGTTEDNNLVQCKKNTKKTSHCAPHSSFSSISLAFTINRLMKHKWLCCSFFFLNFFSVLWVHRETAVT